MSYIVEAIQTDGYSAGYIGNVNGKVQFVYSTDAAFKFPDNSNVESIISSLKKMKKLFPHNRVYKFELLTYVPGYVGGLVRAVIVD